MPSLPDITGFMGDMREQYEISQKFEAAEPNKWNPRPTDMPTQGAGMDHHYRNENDYYYLMEKAREVENNDPAVSQGISRFTDNVVQGGYVHAPDTGVDSLDRLLEERWLSYTDPDNIQGVDHAATSNWHAFERLSARRIVVDGDMMIVPLDTGQLQAFEGHRIRSPMSFSKNVVRRRRYVVHGIEKNLQDQVVRFWLTKHETDGYGFHFRTSQHRRDVRGVNAWELDPLTGLNERNCFHLFDPLRFSQSRGVTAFHAVLNVAGQHADLQFANLVRAQIASYIGFVHKIPISAKTQYEAENEASGDEMYICPETGVMKRKGFELSPGSSFHPQYADEVIEPFTANIPNTNFFEHSNMLLTFVATSLGMPLALFLIDASNTTFSSWKAAVDKFKVHAQTFQRMHSDALHRPVLRFQMRRWLRQDAGMRRMYDVIGPDFFRHSWRYPKWDYVQPKEEVAAEVMELGNLLDSPRGVAARHNRNFTTIITETCEDRANAITCGLDKAEELNKHPYIVANPHETVTWREVMPLPLSDSAQMQLLTGDPEPPEAPAAPASAPGLKTQANS